MKAIENQACFGFTSLKKGLKISKFFSQRTLEEVKNQHKFPGFEETSEPKS